MQVASAAGDVAKGVLSRRELRRSLEKVTAAANDAATAHGWILATAMLRCTDTLAATARQIAESVTDAVVATIRDSTADVLATLQHQSEECHKLVIQITDSYRAVVRQLGWDIFLGLVSAGALVGGAILLATPDLRRAAFTKVKELWGAFCDFRISGPGALGALAVSFAGYRVYVAADRARTFYYRALFYMEREGKLAALDPETPSQQAVIRTTVVAFDERRVLEHGPMAPLFSFRVKKDHSSSYLLVSGVISLFHGGSGAALVHWKWQGRGGQTLVFASQVHTFSTHGIALPTL